MLARPIPMKGRFVFTVFHKAQDVNYWYSLTRLHKLSLFPTLRLALTCVYR